MEGLTQIIPLNGAMNQDDDHRYVRSSDGQVIERINLRPNSIDGKRFINEKIRGNTLINITLPSGDNKCIGWCDDFEHSAIIAFIYNSNYLHCILRYYQKTKTIEKIWYGQTTLGFEDANVRAFIADGMLYWINGNQQPKSFLLDYAVRFTNSVVHDEKYSMLFYPFSDVIFPMIKRPPQFAPTCIYTQREKDPDSGININYNNLRRKMFQFKYRYTYLDNQQSAWSPISKVPLPPYEVDIDGEWDDDITINNTINVTLNTGNAYVKKIDVAVRNCYDRSALGDFYLFKEIDKYDRSFVNTYGDFQPLTISFLNTTVLENINTPINNRYCDDVPLAGNDIMLLDGKYCAISMPVKNYDLVDVDYDLEAVETEIVADLLTAELSYVWVAGSHNWYVINMVFVPNTDYYITFTDHSGVDRTYTLDSTPYTVVAQVSDVFEVLINDDPPSNFDGCVSQVNGGIQQLILNFSGASAKPTNFTAYYYLPNSQGEQAYPSLKRGQYHPFVIIYNDGFGRYAIAQGDKELYSPTEQSCIDEIQFYVNPKVIINSKPPDWAVSYRIGYLPNHSYLWFLYVIGSSVWNGNDLKTNPLGVLYSQYEPSNIKIKDVPLDCYLIPVNNAIWNMREKNPNNFIADYIFTEGDRLRKPCSPETYEILREVTVNFWSKNDNWDTDDPRGTVTGILTKANLADVGKTYATSLEIYRPNPSIQVSTASFNNVFYETGDELEIINPGEANARHGNMQYGAAIPGATSQTLDVNNNVLTPAEIICDFGDVYVRRRKGFTPSLAAVTKWIEDKNYTDFFTSSGMDMGRVTAKIDSEQKTLNSVVRGERFLEGTETNWLNVFLLGTKSFDASDLYGPITGIEEMGGTLKVIQEHKEGSITIGEVTAKFADVGEFTYIGDTVFGAYRRYPEDRGTTYRHSMDSNNRYLYYFDESTGEYIRSSPNGQAPISKEYGMQNWFEKKAKELREFVGYKDVVTSFDNDYEEVLVSFIIGDAIETIVFSEKEGNKGWLEYRTYFNNTDIPELFASFKDTLVSWMNGQMWLHNVGANNTFYGKLHGCSLKAVVNGHVTYTKRYSSIRLSTNNNLWYIEFTIPEGENYPDQKTILRPSMMREKENALYSDILRNIITRVGVENLTLIYNGTRMVGEFMDVEFSDATNADVSLGAVQVNYLIAK